MLFCMGRQDEDDPRGTFPDLTAAGLRKRATSRTNKAVSGYVTAILEVCCKAADKGYLEVRIDEGPPHQMRDTVMQRLRELGFVVGYYDDQRDGGALTVSWGERKSEHR